MRAQRHDAWSEAEDLRLIELAGTMKPGEIAALIGRSEAAVRNRARFHGISVATTYVNRQSWSNEETDFVIDNYQTMTIQQMADKLGRTHTSVHERGRYIGLDMKNYGPKNKKTIYSFEDVQLCRALFKEGLSRQVIAEKMEVPYRCVCLWVAGRGRNVA